jgi:twitching motility protein PilT
MEMLDIIKAAIEGNASDIHLLIGKPPMIRRHGQVVPLAQFPVLTAEISKELIYSMLYEDQIQRFEENLELDSSFEIPHISRFRVNVLRQKNGVEAVLRVISPGIPDPKSLGLTAPIINLTKLPRGLVLVTGPTGCGKTTTLACLIEIINQTRKEHILTIEDPIEFVHEARLAVVTQRELGRDTRSFANALKFRYLSLGRSLPRFRHQDEGLPQHLGRLVSSWSPRAVGGNHLVESEISSDAAKQSPDRRCGHRARPWPCKSL